MNVVNKELVLAGVVCCLGCRQDDEWVLTGRDLLHDLPGEFQVLQCRHCGLMRTSPRPAPECMGDYYPDSYGPYLGTRVGPAPSGIRKIIKPWVHRIFKFNTTWLPELKPGRMLEVGCASGSFLHHMSQRGWQVQGIEFSEKAAKAAMQLGYPVHAGPLETAPPPEQALDLIVGWMVLEHLYDPVGGLKKLHAWAAPGACLVLSVPNAGSYEFRWFREKWYALQLPTHNHHFTPASLEKVLAASGWALEKIHHQRVLSNLIASTGYVLRDKGYGWLGKKLIQFPERAGIWNYVLYPLAWLFSTMGQTGRMTVWARRKPC